MSAIATLRTAYQLYLATQGFGAKVERDALVFELEMPPAWETLLAVLHTGVRAIISSQRWWATVETGKPGRCTRAAVVTLDPREHVPPGTILLCVEGDQRWDRIDPVAIIDLPELFASRQF